MYNDCMEEVDKAYHFWKRIDGLREHSLIEIAESTGIDYNLIKTQRSKNRLPKTLEAIAIAKVVNTSVEWLVTGEEAPLPDKTLDRIRKNAKLYRIAKFLVRADERQLNAVEVVLNINPSSLGVDKSMA